MPKSSLRLLKKIDQLIAKHAAIEAVLEHLASPVFLAVTAMTEMGPCGPVVLRPHS
jgi:hypothetical protein